MSFRVGYVSCALAIVACGGPSTTPTAGPGGTVDVPVAAAVPEPAVPTELASGQGNLVGVEVDATHVFWLEFDTGHIRRMSLSGGAIETVVPGGTGGLTEEMALVGDYVYWTTRAHNAVLRAPKSGGPIDIVAPNQTFATAIDADADYVYWSADGAIRRIPVVGGRIEDIDVGGAAGEQLALDSQYLYVSGVDGASIVRVDKRTRASVVLAADDAPLGATLAVYNEHVYYTASDDSIQRVSRQGGTPQTIAPPRGGTYALAAGREGVYWGAESDTSMGSSVYRMPREGDPVVIAAGYRTIGDIALAGDMVYFVDQDGGTVNRIPRSMP